MAARSLLGAGNFAVGQTAKPLFSSGQKNNGKSQNVQASNQHPRQTSNDNGNQQPDQNNQNGGMDGIRNQGKTLTREIAKKFLDLANGSKDLARELARKAGYSW